LPNFLEPLGFDLFDAQAPVAAADAIYCANVIHIAPPEAIPHLFRHAKSVLPSGAPLILYGPFRYRERELEPSNLSFNEWLAERFPGGGIREFETVRDIANSAGFEIEADIEMPANNRLLVFRRGR